MLWRHSKIKLLLVPPCIGLLAAKYCPFVTKDTKSLSKSKMVGAQLWSNIFNDKWNQL